MKKVMTVLLAALFAVSTGVMAASHMKGDKDMSKDDAKKTQKKGDGKKKAD